MNSLKNKQKTAKPVGPPKIHTRHKFYKFLRKKWVYIPLYAVVVAVIATLLASPYLPQVQSTAQSVTKAHPALAKIVPKALQPPNLDLPTTGNWLIIPAAEIKMPIIEGSSIDVLIKNVGVWHETGDIDHNYVIAGHKLQYFRSVNQSLYHLNELKVGDNNLIVVNNGQPHYYTVTAAEIVAPTDVAILNPTSSAQLTIYTCNDFFNHSRFVVIAQPTAS